VRVPPHPIFTPNRNGNSATVIKKAVLYCSNDQINICCLHPDKDHKCSYTLLIMKLSDMNTVNVAYLCRFSWDGLQAPWLGFKPRIMGYFPLAMMSFLALVFTQHNCNSKAWRHAAEFAHLMPRCLHVMVLMLGRELACLLCVFLVVLSLCLWRVHEWVCPAVPIYMSLSIVPQAVLQVQPVVISYLNLLMEVLTTVVTSTIPW
jgi:hypothetical protein